MKPTFNLPELPMPAHKLQDPDAAPIAQEVEVILSTFPADTARRLLGLYRKWREPDVEKALTKTEHKELVLAGIIKEEITKIDNKKVYPKHVSQRNLAEILTEETGTAVHYQEISKLMLAGRKDGNSGIALFEKGKSGMIEREGAVAWWIEHKTAKSVSGSSPSSEAIKQRKLLAEAEIAERENEQQKRKFDEGWMRTSSHTFAMSSIGTAALNTIKQTIEKNLRDRIENVLRGMIVDVNLQNSIICEVRKEYPSMVDMWQQDFCIELDRVANECVENSNKEKESL